MTPSSHYCWDNFSGTLLYKQVSRTHLKIGHQDSNPGNGHQVTYHIPSMDGKVRNQNETSLPLLFATHSTMLNTVYHQHQQPLLLQWINFNTLRLRRNEQHFADDIFKRIFFNENVWISLKISLKFVPKGPIINIPTLVQIMSWRRSGDKPLSEPMMVSLPTHICVTRPQWVNPNMDK